MKNLENRITRLEIQLPNSQFLIVFPHKNEDRESAIHRSLLEQKTKKSAEDFFIIYLNLHAKSQHQHG
jgi:hypothetical protein